MHSVILWHNSYIVDNSSFNVKLWCLDNIQVILSPQVWCKYDETLGCFDDRRHRLHSSIIRVKSFEKNKRKLKQAMEIAYRHIGRMRNALLMCVTSNKQRARDPYWPTRASKRHSAVNVDSSCSIVTRTGRKLNSKLRKGNFCKHIDFHVMKIPCSVVRRRRGCDERDRGEQDSSPQRL